MAAYFSSLPALHMQYIPAQNTSQPPYNVIDRWTGLNGRIDIRVHLNPKNAILHTVLVHENGFIHTTTHGGVFESGQDGFFRELHYPKWIQSDE